MIRGLCVGFFVFAILGISNLVHAADSAVVGQWISNNNKGRHVEMDFTNDGQCHLKSTEKGKTTKVDGVYQVTGDRLVITSNDHKPILYSMSVQNDSLTLNGGWLAIAQPMTLTKKGAQVVPPPAPPMPQPTPTPPTPTPPAPTNPPAPQDPPKTEAPASASTAGLPGGSWDIHALEQAFTILKTKYDPSTNKVTWLLEKNVDGYLSVTISFYDEDDVKLGSDYLTFDPGIAGVAKSERTRATAPMLKEEDMKKVKKVVLTKS